MATTCAFRMEGMNGTAFQGGDGIFDEAGFIQRICMDHDLHIIVISHG